jgi:signal peptidase
MPLLPIEQNIEIKIVESGSMEPAIMTGSLVVVVPQDDYKLSDVITFNSVSADIPTTHRITNIEEREGVLWYTTKGDANEEVDTTLIPRESIIGKVALAVPYAGFILDFARQPAGFLLLIVLPAFMIVLGEIEKIFIEIKKRRKDKSTRAKQVTPAVQTEKTNEIREVVRMIEIGKPVYSYETIVRIQPARTRQAVGGHTLYVAPFREALFFFLAFITSICFASIGFIGSTVSYFNDSESSTMNTFEAQELDFTVLADAQTYRFVGNALDDEDGALITIATPTVGSTEMKYAVSVSLTGPQTLFCESILVDASAPLQYQGPIMALSGFDVVFDEPWVLAISLPSNYGPFVAGETCGLEIVYTAHDSANQNSLGYTDTEKVSLTFTAPETLLPAIEPMNLFVPESFVGELVTEEVSPVEEEVTPVPIEEVVQEAVVLNQVTTEEVIVTNEAPTVVEEVVTEVVTPQEAAAPEGM